ncbi:hypothetical protein NM688_g691 [Phlebia brevispora]|uniref:Uncharacterized protein n=1 Tax=Phlebia brevispora TaxID=194682 RepID=A0ACC1TDY7_9APHY|nr:hypothetical protein NM688_g691 [Phlebia brevispora]
MTFLLGSIFKDRYAVLRELSMHQYSSVWLVQDTISSNYAALKLRFGPTLQAPLCGCLRGHSLLPKETDPHLHPGQAGILHVLDSFNLTKEGVDPVECVIYPLLGQNVLKLSHPDTVTLPWEVMRRIALQLLLILDYIHNIKGIVHTDIHPGNILIQPALDQVYPVVEEYLTATEREDKHPSSIPFPLPNENEVYVTLIDFDSAHLSADNAIHAFATVQPEHLRSPEVTIGAVWGTPADIWNLGCLLFEMASGRHLFATDDQNHDSTVQLARMMSVFGEFPMEFLTRGQRWTTYFSNDGKLKYEGEAFPNLPFEALVYLYVKEPKGSIRPDHEELTDDEVITFADFLSQMIRLRPEDRETASGLLDHDWLKPALRTMIEEVKAAADSPYPLKSRWLQS